MHFPNLDDFYGLICEIGQNRTIPVPLKNVQMNAKVVDFIAQVEIYQEYINSESNPIQVLYSYPVEESAAIIGE